MSGPTAMTKRAAMSPSCRTTWPTGSTTPSPGCGAKSGRRRKRTPGPSRHRALEEYDYYLRGHQLFFRFTKEDNAKARAIWQEGLGEVSRFRAAADENRLHLLSGFVQRLDRRSLARHGNWHGSSARKPRPFQNKSRLETLLSHWMMANSVPIA